MPFAQFSHLKILPCNTQIFAFLSSSHVGSEDVVVSVNVGVGVGAGVGIGVGAGVGIGVGAGPGISPGTHCWYH